MSSNCCYEKNGMVDLHGTETNKYIMFKTDDNRAGESSFLIRNRYEGDELFVLCETGNKIIVDFLDRK